MKPHRLTVPFVAIMWFAASFTYSQEEGDGGMLSCVANIRRVEPRIAASSNKSSYVVAASHSSAFIVRDPAYTEKNAGETCRVFYVTAAHNLIDCKDVELTVSASMTTNTKGFSIFSKESSFDGSFSGSLLKQFVYIDIAEDIAVVEATEESASTELLPTKKWVGQLLLAPVENINKAPVNLPKEPELLPRGAIASAAGTSHSPQKDIIHPAYSCTLSRNVKGANIVSFAVKSNYQFTIDTPLQNKDNYKKAIYDRIRSQQYLLIESMSITCGFSGSPVMISKDHFVSDGRIVGMVLGGQTDPGVGRFAWAIPADTICAAIANLKLANDGKLKWKKLSNTYAEDGFIVFESDIPGKWVFNRSSDMLKSVLNDRLYTPFLSQFGSESRIEFTAERPDAPLCGEDLKSRIQNLPGRSFVFRDLTFDKECLNKVHLLSPYFINCKFLQTEFKGAVLSGATFENCKFLNSENKSISLREVIERPCPLCSPAAIIAPQIFEAR